MFRHALPGIHFRKQLAGLMHWLLTVARLSTRRSPFWGISPSIFLTLLSGCSLESDNVRLSQEEFQQAVNIGYLAPQIRTFDLQPLMLVQVYLDTPTVIVGEEQGEVRFTIKGKLDAQILKGRVTKALAMTVSGESGLVYDTGERAIYMAQVVLEDTLIDLDVAMFRAMILSKFQKALADELERIPLISLAQTPELEEQLLDLAEKGNIQIRVENQNIMFQHVHPL